MKNNPDQYGTGLALKESEFLSSKIRQIFKWCEKKGLDSTRVVKRVDRGCQAGDFDMTQFFFKTERQKREFLQDIGGPHNEFFDRVFTDEVFDHTPSKDTWAMLAAGFVRTFNRVWFQEAFADCKDQYNWRLFRASDLHVLPEAPTVEEVKSLQLGIFRIRQYPGSFEGCSKLHNELCVTFGAVPCKHHIIAVDEGAWSNIYMDDNPLTFPPIILKDCDSSKTSEDILHDAIEFTYNLSRLPRPSLALKIHADDHRPASTYSAFYSASYM